MHSDEVNVTPPGERDGFSLSFAFVLSVALHCLFIGGVTLFWEAPQITAPHTLHVKLTSSYPVPARVESDANEFATGNAEETPVSIPETSATNLPFVADTYVERTVQPSTETPTSSRPTASFDPRAFNQFLDAASRRGFVPPESPEAISEQYKRQWHKRVQRIGQLNYPRSAIKDRLSGLLALRIAINANGSLASVGIEQSSGHRALDRAAVEIVRSAAPFSPLPPNMPRTDGEYRFTSTWEFRR